MGKVQLSRLSRWTSNTEFIRRSHSLLRYLSQWIGEIERLCFFFYSTHTPPPRPLKNRGYLSSVVVRLDIKLERFQYLLKECKTLLTLWCSFDREWFAEMSSLDFQTICVSNLWFNRREFSLPLSSLLWVHWCFFTKGTLVEGFYRAGGCTYLNVESAFTGGELPLYFNRL